jgi:iron complex outermembrane recepter protein
MCFQFLAADRVVVGSSHLLPAFRGCGASGLAARREGRVRKVARLLLVGMSMLSLLSPAVAAPEYAQLPPTMLKRMSVEELLAQEVFSVSRRPEAWGQTAGSIFALTGDAARLSGSTSLPQVLRLAPNLFVAQASASHWGINARGFMRTNAHSNKLLVLIDGRTVYSPFFSNVFWDATDVFMPDLERVEIISGPAGANWGSNAVNGVINVVTKPAQLTQGTLVYGAVGTFEQANAGVRHGGRWGDTGAYRVYAKTAKLGSTYTAAGESDNFDEGTAVQAGFRTDWGGPDRGEFTLSGDAFQGRFDNGAAPQLRVDTANILARWSRTLGDSHWLLRAYHDYAMRDIQRLYVARTRTVDVELQHRFHPSHRQTLVWGGHYRRLFDHVSETVGFGIVPRRLDFALAGVFAQHELDFNEGRVRLTTGLRLENNHFTGWEHQPHLRMAWRPDSSHTFWASIGRTTRTPSRLETGFEAPPFTVANPDFASEVLVAQEVGWRGTIRRGVAVSASLFHHDYDQLRSVELVPTVTQANGVRGRSYGGELFVDWDVTPWWRLRTGGFWMDQDTRPRPGSTDAERGYGEVSFPSHQVLLRSTFWMARGVTLWFSLRHVDEVPSLEGPVLGHVPAYTELDARIAWMLRPGLEASLTGRNLFDRSHPEIGTTTGRREIPRNVQAMIRWEF